MAIKSITIPDAFYLKQTYRGNPLNTIEQRFTTQQYRDGNEKPNWQQVIADGGNATTNLEAYLTSVDHSAGGWVGGQPGYANSSSEQQGIQGVVIPSTFNPPSDLVAEATNGATTKAYQIINKLLSELQGQVFLGELRETVRLLRNPFAQSVRTFQSFHSKGKGKRGDEFAKSWLEFQFGIKPLLSDIDTIMGFINDKIETESRKSFRAYHEALASQSSVVVGSYDINYFTNRVETITDWKAQKIIRFNITQQFLDMANERRTDWRRQFDDISALPITAWELTPFSFLLDYFVNVSDIIQAAVTSTAGVSFWSNSLIRTVTSTKIGSATGATGGRFIISNIPRVLRTQKRWVSRNGSALGIPSVQFSLPGSNIRYLNIAALAATLTAEMRRAKR